jgi:spermidine/putrescine transport system permease protein
VKKIDLVVRFLGKVGLWLNAILGFAFLYIPILILVIYSFNSSRFNAVWRGFTLDWYRSLLEGNNLTNVIIWDALNNSFIVGIISTLIATILGTMLALALEGFHFRGKGVINGLLLLPIIIPDLAMGISLLVFFTLVFQLWENLTGIRLVLGLPTVIIGHIAFNISFVTVTVRGSIAQLDPSIAEAAEDLGANEWQTLWRITLPLIAPAIVSAALLAFTLSFDDFVITFFTTGVGATTLPLYVYGMIKFSVTPAINAISTLILLASLILILVNTLILKNRAEKI